jgi:outer membrane protein TolC
MKSLATFILLSLIHLSVVAQEAISLSDAIQIGLSNNYQIEIAERNIEIAQQNNSWELAGRYPTVSFNLQGGNSYLDQFNPASFIRELTSVRSDWTGRIDVQWTIFDGFRVKLTKARLEELERISKGNASLAVQATIEDIILAYYQALVQQEQLKVINDVLLLSRDRIAYQEVRKEFGQATSFDLLQTQDAYLNDSTALLIQQNNLNNTLRNLNRAMGVDDFTRQYLLTTPLDEAPKRYIFSDLQQRMLASNVNLQNLYLNRELAKLNTQLRESEKYPVLSIDVGASYNENFSKLNAINPQTGEQFGAVNGNAFTGFANVNLIYPIYTGGMRKRNIANAKVEEIVAQLGVEDLKRNLSMQLANNYATYENQLQLLELTDRVLENAARNLEIAEERFKGGLISSFDYRTIQLGYINASQSRLNAYFNLKLTETELVRLTGGLVN